MNYSLTFLSEPILQPIEGPTRLFRIVEDFPVMVNGKLYVILKNSHTDFASIPQLFENIIDNDDPRILRASIFHDLAYQHVGKIWDDSPALSFTDVNHLLSAGMASCGADPIIRATVYGAVEVGAYGVWLGYEHAIKTGTPYHMHMLKL